MKITDIDKNFIQQSADENTVWLDAKNSLFKIYGVFYDSQRKAFVRVPHHISKEANEGIDYLATNTAGGRVVFNTNSSTLSLKCVIPNAGIMTTTLLMRSILSKRTIRFIKRLGLRIQKCLSYLFLDLILIEILKLMANAVKLQKRLIYNL